MTPSPINLSADVLVMFTRSVYFLKARIVSQLPEAWVGANPPVTPSASGAGNCSKRRAACKRPNRSAASLIRPPRVA
jgi:hypothetical protein